MSDGNGIQTVRVIDVDMSFWNMVGFMFKWAFAAIPALLAIAFVCFIVVFAFMLIVGGLGAGLGSLGK